MTPQLSTLPNFRDVGGVATRDGAQVSVRKLYRSVSLDKLDETDRAALEGLGIGRVYDLRTMSEQSSSPDRLPGDASYVALDILADAKPDAPAQLQDVLIDPRAAEGILADGKAVTLFHQAYRDIVSLPSALRGYRRFFTDLASPEAPAALVHCATGKDRTGWAAAALLTFLGVHESDVTQEYLRSNTDLLPALKPLFDRFAEAGGDPDLLLPVLGVREEYLQTACREVEERFGGIEGYFADGLGLTELERDRLRTTFLE